MSEPRMPRAPRKLVTDELKETIRRMYVDERQNVSVISVKLNLGRSTIHQNIARMGITLRHCPQSGNARRDLGKRSNMFNEAQIDEIVAEWKAGKSLHKISAARFCSPPAIKNALRTRGAYDGRQGRQKERLVTVIGLNPYTQNLTLSNELRVPNNIRKPYKVGDVWTERTFPND